ncbi:hypothetical protein WJX82_001591 [Trebouxia sp. C0006]
MYLALKREGPDLATLLNDPSHLFTLQEIIIGFQGLAAGMAHMHSKGVVNQNFHAGNVLLSQDGQTLIKTDLGKAAWTETDGQPTFLSDCWCGAGCESPEVAKGYLQDGGYEPLPSSDVYAFGLLLLATIGGQQPEQQVELQRSTAYLAELQDGFWVDSIQLEGQRKHLEWLRDLLVDPTKPDYADLVQYPSRLQGNDKQLVANSQKIRQEISKGRFRISQLAFADFEFKQSPDLEPGTRFFRHNQIILERVWAGAEWFSDLVKVVATLTADGQLGIVLLGRLQDNIGFGVDLLKAVTKLRDTFSDDQKEIGKAMKMGGDVQEYLYAAIMLPATELEVAKDLMGVAVVQVSTAVHSKAPTATRGIQALQELLSDPHLRGVELLMLAQAISQHNSAMCDTEAGAEVKLVGQEETSMYKPHTKQAITLLAGVCQEVANNSKWRYAHQAFEPILEVVQVVKQSWRNQVATKLVQPVVEQAESDPAALSLLVGYCIGGCHRDLLERVTSELGQTDILKLLMSQGKEGAVLRLLKHYDTRPVTQRVGFKLLQPVEHQLHLLRNSRDNISIFLDIINLEMMKPRHKEQIEGVQEHWKPGQLKILRREAIAQVDKGTHHQMLAGDTVTHTETCAMMNRSSDPGRGPSQDVLASRPAPPDDPQTV